MAVIGFDPGVHGAIALLSDDGQLLEIHDMPETEECSGRHATNAPLLASIIVQLHARVAFCEFVASRPSDAKIAAFAFGRSRGVIEGVCAAYDLPLVFITAPVWKRLADVPPGKEHKDVARTKAIARWPAMAGWFKLKTKCDRADAALIAAAGLQLEKIKQAA